MLSRLCDGVTGITRVLLWIGFATMILAVTLQVLARNVILVPMIWTSDLAQLTFTWLIFLGAAVGLRLGMHYNVDVLPHDRPGLQRVLFGIELAAGAAVSALLMMQGWKLAMMRAGADIQSLGISRMWIYLPIPVSGALMALFLVEMAARAMFREPRS